MFHIQKKWLPSKDISNGSSQEKVKHQKNTIPQQKQEITGQHILKTLVHLIKQTDDDKQLREETTALLSIIEKDCDIFMEGILSEKVFPLHTITTRIEVIKELETLTKDYIEEIPTHSRQNILLSQLFEHLEEVRMLLRQIFAMTKMIKEQKRVKKLTETKRTSQPYLRGELLQHFEKRAQRIIDHLYHISPMIPHGKRTLSEELLHSDIIQLKKIYGALILHTSNEEQLPQHEEQKLLLTIARTSQQIRGALYYCIGKIPKDLNYPREKGKITQPEHITEELYKCPITGVVGGKQEFDVHHIKKQSLFNTSHKENITYILRDFHVLYHYITDNKLIEEPVIRIKNMVSFQQGDLKEDLAKPSSPLLNLIGHLKAEKQHIKQKAHPKLRQLLLASWKQMHCIRKLHTTLPNPEGTPLQPLYHMTKELFEHMIKHLKNTHTLFSQETPSYHFPHIQEDIIEQYLFAKKDFSKKHREHVIQAHWDMLMNTEKKLLHSFSPDHPTLTSDEFQWYIMSLYRIVCDAVRGLLMETPFVLNKNILITIQQDLTALQGQLLKVVQICEEHTAQSTPGNFRIQLSKVLKQEDEIYHHLTLSLFLDEENLPPQENIPQSIKHFVKDHRKRLPEYFANYRKLLLYRGIPETLLYNIHLYHTKQLQKENGAVQLRSLSE